MLGEQVIDRLASRGQDLLAAAQDGRTVRRSQLLDVGLVRRRQRPVPLAEVDGDLGGVAERDGVAVPEPEPAGHVERRLAALEGPPRIAAEQRNAEVQQAADDGLSQAQRLGKPDAGLEDARSLRTVAC